MKGATMLLGLLALIFFSIIMLSRPYSTDLLGYLWWRVSGPGISERRIQTNHASISYASTGTGPTLVLLHGGLSSSLDWYALVPPLSRHFRLILIDTQGHGSSSLGGQTLGYNMLAQDVISVLDGLSLSRVDVAGWSDGGNIGLLLALNHPDRVGKLVAISANAHPDGLTDDAVANIERFAVQEPSLLSRLLYRWQSPDHSALQRVRDEVTRMWQGKPVLSDDALTRIDTPTLLIIGAQDDVALEHAQHMARLLPHAELEVIPDVRHNVPQAASAPVLASMLAFLTVKE